MTVQLQEYFSDGVWRNRGAVGNKRVQSGGGSGQRATGRAQCANRNRAGWRCIVDVDLVNFPDTSEKIQTDDQSIECTKY